MVGVEPHVLRYWEEELELPIERDAQGKRCYTRKDVERLREIKFWKDKGMQLRAVKEILAQPEISEEFSGSLAWDLEFLLDEQILRLGFLYRNGYCDFNI